MVRGRGGWRRGGAGKGVLEGGVRLEYLLVRSGVWDLDLLGLVHPSGF